MNDNELKTDAAIAILDRNVVLERQLIKEQDDLAFIIKQHAKTKQQLKEMGELVDVLIENFNDTMLSGKSIEEVWKERKQRILEVGNV